MTGGHVRFGQVSVRVVPAVCDWFNVEPSAVRSLRTVERKRE